jgi:hypothetical protein
MFQGSKHCGIEANNLRSLWPEKLALKEHSSHVTELIE